MTGILTVKVNYILDAQNNGKFNLDIFNYKNLKKTDHKHQRYEEKCEKYKISQKPAKRLLNNWNVVIKFQPFIFYRSRENHVSLKLRHTDISNYRVASLLKM